VIAYSLQNKDNVKDKEKEYETIFYLIRNCRSDRGSSVLQFAFCRGSSTTKFPAAIAKHSRGARNLCADCFPNSIYYSFDDTGGCQSRWDIDV
jgi:hypothetical protein